MNEYLRAYGTHGLSILVRELIRTPNPSAGLVVEVEAGLMLLEQELERYLTTGARYDVNHG